MSRGRDAEQHFLPGTCGHYTDIMPIRINRREFQELVRERSPTCRTNSPARS